MSESVIVRRPDVFMPATARLKSRRVRWILVAILACCCAGPATSAQTQPATPKPTETAPRRDLTQPQAQPSLTIDSDPILSPDPVEKAAAVEATSTTPSASSTHPGDKTPKKESNGYVF